MDHFHNVRKMASEIYAYAPDARVLTTYYCGMIPFFVEFKCVNYLSVSRFCLLFFLTLCDCSAHNIYLHTCLI